MIKSVLFVFAIITTAVSAYAGDNGGGQLKCASSSGRTKVEGGAGADWNGSGPALLYYTIDGSSMTLDPTKQLGTEAHLVDFVAYVNKTSYSVSFKRSKLYGGYNGSMVFSDTVFQLRSLPGTFTQIQPDIYKFKAVIPEYSSIDPRKGSDLSKDFLEKFDKDIEVNCVLNLTV